MSCLTKLTDSGKCLSVRSVKGNLLNVMAQRRMTENEGAYCGMDCEVKLSL